jgi:hypothetical protein
VAKVTEQLGAQVGHRGEDTAGDHVPLDLGEPVLHLIEPGGIGRRIVDADVWVFSQESRDQRQFPALKATLEQRFPGMRLLPWDQRISAIALGAAWQAASLQRNPIDPGTPAVSSPSKEQPNPATMSVHQNSDSEENQINQQLSDAGESLMILDHKLSLDKGLVKNLRKVIRICKDFKFKTLDLSGKWNDDDIEAFSEFTQVVKLELSSCREVTDEAILYISRMKSLTKIDLSPCFAREGLTAAGFRVLSRLPNLEVLNLPDFTDNLSSFDREFASWRNLVAYLKKENPHLVVHPSQFSENPEDED